MLDALILAAALAVIFVRKIMHKHTFKEDEWPFSCSINSPAVTTKFVYERLKPIIQVNHFLDDGWQFMCNSTEDPKDGMVICMGCFISKFPEMIELAALPKGWDAYREDEGQPWDKQQFE